MASYVGEDIARKAYEDGIKVGETEPTRETKGSWWEVMLNGEDLIACVMTEEWGVSCGESITWDELGGYIDEDASKVRTKFGKPHQKVSPAPAQ